MMERPSRTTELGPADAERAAAALDLHVPVDVVGAAGVDDVVHHRRLLGVVAAGELGRAHEQAAVVRGQLDAVERVGLRQRRGHALVDERAVLVQHLHGVEHLDAVVERAAEDLRHALGEALFFGDRVARRRKPVVAGGAGREHAVEALRLGERQVACGKRHAEQVVGGVAAARAAAVPVGDLGDGDTERLDDCAQALVELGRGAVQRAARVVGDAARCLLPRGVVGHGRHGGVCGGRAERRLFGAPLDGRPGVAIHGVTPHCSKILLISFTPSILSARRFSLPRANMPGALVTSFMRSPVLSL